jgi:AraC-like DNA-binding protein
MSHTGQLDRSYIRPYEQAPRPLVGYARDYVAGHGTGWHQHPRAQLLYATAGVMRVETCPAMFIVPPGTGLWVPADTSHVTRMPAGLSMRALFLREDAARAGPRCVTVVAVSPLLRELILAACAEGVVWDEEGPVQHVVALARHEISRAPTRPISVPACNDPRLRRVTEALLANPADPRGLDAFAMMAGASSRTLARLFRRETGMSFHAWRRQLRLTEALALLSQGTPPARAAAAVGYGTSPSFGAAFRAVFGMTPGQAGRGGYTSPPVR